MSSKGQVRERDSRCSRALLLRWTGCLLACTCLGGDSRGARGSPASNPRRGPDTLREKGDRARRAIGLASIPGCRPGHSPPPSDACRHPIRATEPPQPAFLHDQWSCSCWNIGTRGIHFGEHSRRRSESGPALESCWLPLGGRRAYDASIPPPTSITWPVMKLPSSLANSR